MTFSARPLQEHIGTEIQIQPELLASAPVVARLRELLVQRGVLVFKQLHLNDDQQLTLARLLGNLREELGKGIYKITLDKKSNAHAEYLKGSFLWHIDGTHDDIPPFATLLTGHSLSETGGQTEFANSYAAYEALPQATKDKLEGLKVEHSVELSMSRAGVEATEDNLNYWRSFPAKQHNLVWTHKSGRKSLVIGCHASHVVGMDKQESDALLSELLEWATRPEFVYRHEWSPGDLIIWDNTGVIHRVEPYPLDCGRVMHRSTLMAEEPFA
ncbi:MAG: taurine catabolism dioxygenase [Pseudomonadales bacterium]|nr:taurine catabolism dioxygenase [Pseudomonadales bacterium]